MKENHHSVSADVQSLLRTLPPINEIAEAPELAHWRQLIPRQLIVNAARRVIAQIRHQLVSDDGESRCLSVGAIAKRVDEFLIGDEKCSLPEVINGTGIILHTGLGRAPLSARALQAIVIASAAYTPLEFDLETGNRGRRVDAVRKQLCELTGAESATVVNNNAAAILIALNSMAAGKDVVISRGELIELGGTFRLPEVMSVSGCKLKEVGTTNKTRLPDYSSAIDDATGALLKVHCSNYQVCGFTEAVGLTDLVALGRQHHIPVIHDLGSGALFDMREFGLPEEPVASASISAGADLVLFSGDKLLGGPQAGIIVGSRKFIEAIERNPLARALRVEKMTLAALSATLRALRHSRQAQQELPVWMMIAASIDELERRASAIVENVTSKTRGWKVAVISTMGYLGGGSAPNQSLKSVAIAISSETCSENTLAERLRQGDPPIVARLEKRSLIIDLRTVLPQQDDVLSKALIVALNA